MNAEGDASRGAWLVRNRMTLVSLLAVAVYAVFVQWIWGWPTLFRQWAEIGIVPVLSALALLVGTYFIRCYRIYDYFPKETRGRFLKVFPNEYKRALAEMHDREVMAATESGTRAGVHADGVAAA